MGGIVSLCQQPLYGRKNIATGFLTIFRTPEGLSNSENAPDSTKCGFNWESCRESRSLPAK